MIAVGIGCRLESSADEVLVAIQRALSHYGRTIEHVHSLYTAEFKREQVALQRAADALGKPLTFLPMIDLQEHSDRALTRSEHVLARWGVPSVAETAALAGARAVAAEAGSVRLLGPRVITEGVTCALATQESNP